MSSPATFSAVELLADGRRIEIRALKPTDQADLLAAVDHTSDQSLYRRFFGAKRDFSEKEISFFLNVDFTEHVALVAVMEEGGRPVIVGGGRYVLVRPKTAELAFTVVDEYQGRGIGVLLMRHLITLAREAGLEELIAEVLPNNTAMLKVLARSGLDITTKRESGIVHVALRGL